MLEILDTNGDDLVDREEFYVLSDYGMYESTLRHYFDKFYDHDGDEYLDLDELALAESLRRGVPDLKQALK